MTELQCTLWINSLPACSVLNEAMQKFTEDAFATSEQHQEATESRQKRDCEDTEKIVSFLQERSPFRKEDLSLHSIMSRVVAQDAVNVDQAEVIGKHIIESMKGQDVTQYSFKRKCQATTLG